MSIFQKSVIQKYLQTLDETKVNSAYQTFQKFYGNQTRLQNIERLKEESFQEGFLREIFVQVLGYTINPDPAYNLTTEFKNQTDSKKADGAILKDGQAIGVIELKSTKTTDLESIRQQAFNYKNNQPECKYIITSNFRLLRFYVENATEYEEFNLFSLSQAEFRKFFLILNREHLLAEMPSKLKAETKFHEENISAQFYKDYSSFKNKIFNNLVHNNPQFDKLTLFKKSQKLLDRLLFTFFAEDRGLVPPNAINRIIEQWQHLKDLEAYQPLYDRFKKFFEHLNSGHDYKDYVLPPYNGGLFAADKVLDTVKIEDEILVNDSLKLSQYDFSTEIDVNILGHIFEHSLSEIEEITAELAGAPVDKQKSKRKKDGIYYTPKYITRYIVENTVGALCREKKEALEILNVIPDETHRKADGKISKKGEALYHQLEAYKAWLLTLKIVDPACGSGAFLNQALEFLIEEHTQNDALINELLNQPLGLYNTYKEILENNLFGVDLNEESVEIARLSLWLRTARKGRKLSMLNDNIKCGNSLIDDPAVAGDKAFNWEKEFPEIMAKGGFDVVIGNPPYVRAELLGPFRNYLVKNYAVFNPAGDLFSYFYEKSFKLLKSKTGLFGFISNTFDKTTAGIAVRDYLQNEVIFLKYVDFTEVQIFEGATTYPIIIIAQNQKGITNSFSYIKIPKSSQDVIIDIENHPVVEVAQKYLERENWSFKSHQSVKLINKLNKQKNVRMIYGKCYYGVKTALNEAFIVPKIFPIGEHVKAIFEGKEIEKWINPESIQQLILFKSKWTRETYGEGITEKIALEKLKKDFPELINHILPFEKRAKERYDKGDFFWELRNCAYYDLFEKPKIVFPNLQNSNKFAYDATGAYINAPAVILPTEDRFLLAILNSKLVWYFLINICVVRNGGYIEVKPQYFEQIPIPELTDDQKLKLDELTKTAIDTTKECRQIKSKLIKLLKNKFFQIKMTKILENWYNFNFNEFSMELKKQKFKISIADESEWMDFFDEQTNAFGATSKVIHDLGKQIDQLVYQLYGLTPEEIEIVENSVK